LLAAMIACIAPENRNRPWPGLGAAFEYRVVLRIAAANLPVGWTTCPGRSTSVVEIAVKEERVDAGAGLDVVEKSLDAY